MSWRVDVGDCVTLMQAMEPCSVDAVVCDPPYGLEFMGKEWDKLAGGKSEPDTHRRFREGVQAKGRRSGVHSLEQGHPSFRQIRGERCDICGKMRGGATAQGSRCECSSPIFRSVSRGAEQQAWHRVWVEEAFGVLKPGGHLLAFGGTRTSHRLACAIEDAGFEIRDTICWLYGSGFPKSLDVGKAIDKAAGEPRGTEPDVRNGPNTNRTTKGPPLFDGGFSGNGALDAGPVTSDAERWDGWGTALKPAHEPIVVARKPLAGTVAANVLEHGTGALNVDGCRIEAQGRPHIVSESEGSLNAYGDGLNGSRAAGQTNLGRWPANVVLDEEAARQLDQQSGERASGKMMPTAVRSTSRNAYGRDADSGYTTMETYGDSGGASRFMYVAKASRAERNAGLDGFSKQSRIPGGPGRQAEGTGERIPTANHHPTVKPVNLMRWLCRLVTPPGGLVLDPFCGSGTTGIAAALEGFNFHGCEQDEAYGDIARARIGWWELHGHDALRIVVEQEAAENEREAVRASGQMELL